MKLDSFKEKFATRLHVENVVDTSFLKEVDPPQIPRPDIPEIPDIEFESCGEFGEKFNELKGELQGALDKVNSVKNKMFDAVQGVVDNLTEKLNEKIGEVKEGIDDKLKQLKSKVDGVINTLKEKIPDFPELPEFPELPDFEIPEMPWSKEDMTSALGDMKECGLLAAGEAGEAIDTAVAALDKLESMEGLSIKDEATRRVMGLVMKKFEKSFDNLLSSTPLGKLDEAKGKLNETLGITHKSPIDQLEKVVDKKTPDVTDKFSKVDEIVGCIQAGCDAWAAYEAQKEKMRKDSGVDEEGYVLPTDPNTGPEVPEHLQEEAKKQEKLVEEVKYKLQLVKNPEKSFPHLNKKLGVRLPLLGGNERVINGTISSRYDMDTGKFYAENDLGKALITGEYDSVGEKITIGLISYGAGQYYIVCDTSFGVRSVSSRMEEILSGDPEVSLGSHFAEPE